MTTQPDPITAETLARMREMSAEGMSCAKIGEALGLGESRVYRHLTRHKRPVQLSFLESAEKTWPLLATSWTLDCSNGQLGILAGCSKATARKYRLARGRGEVAVLTPTVLDHDGKPDLLLEALRRVYPAPATRRMAA